MRYRCRCGALDCPRCHPSVYTRYREHTRTCQCWGCREREYEMADAIRDEMLDKADFEMEVRADDLRY